MDPKLILTLATIVLNVIVLVVIKFNDLRHLAIDVKELNGKVNNLDGRVDKLAERIAKIEGKLEK